ncbi:hypothetical protein DFP72DRAFT_850448 [Ephemerocybe angulata]|uniref:Uncharacterized protein n=1 Tax=Ephemerocybe angulata TaxID=980116 RepID=A0A8H6HRP7_9AGAR|nr:hypothetical protein DFP72DRAFT_850448 [Tulosesus angulatus]
MSNGYRVGRGYMVARDSAERWGGSCFDFGCRVFHVQPVQLAYSELVGKDFGQFRCASMLVGVEAAIRAAFVSTLRLSSQIPRSTLDDDGRLYIVCIAVYSEEHAVRELRTDKLTRLVVNVGAAMVDVGASVHSVRCYLRLVDSSSSIVEPQLVASFIYALVGSNLLTNAPFSSIEPSENWDDDFEFNPSASPSPAPPSPSSSRRHQQHYQQQQQQLYTLSEALSPGTRLSIASSEYTMEDWDAESAFGAGSSPPRMEGDEEEFSGGGVHTPTRNRSPRDAGSSSPKRRLDDAVPVPISLALAAWSEEPELVLPRTPMKRAVGLDVEENAHQHLTLARHSSQVGLVSTEEAENWDDDFEDEGTRKAVSPARAGLSLKKREEDEEVAHESWDEEFAAEEEAQRATRPDSMSSYAPRPGGLLLTTVLLTTRHGARATWDIAGATWDIAGGHNGGNMGAAYTGPWHVPQVIYPA